MYESLARFQWWRARRAVAKSALDGLELRKRLLPAGGDDLPADGGAGLDAWLLRLCGGCEGQRVLDLGCGFGATLLRAVEAGAASGVGVTPSRYQVRRAREVAGARGVGARCTFDVRDLDAGLPPGDLVVAIEALGHTPRLERVLANVAAAIRGSSRGRFVWLEDLLRDRPGDEPDVRSLAAAWCSPPLRSVAECDAALDAAGLRVTRAVELTTQVPRRDVATIDRAIGRLRRSFRLTPLPFARRVLRAFLGGLLLERLYARERACYRLVMAEPMPGALA